MKGVELIRRYRKGKRDFAGADLQRAHLRDAHLEGVNLAGSDLSGANLADAWLSGADLTGANLSGANLAEADFNGAHLARAILAHAILRHARLEGANLSGANLAGSDFSSANLADANLAGANLGGAILKQAYLAGANLGEASLGGANFVNANLAGANLGGADLAESNFYGADLTNVDLAKACCLRTAFANVDLRRVKGLDLVEHYGPSTVGVDTLCASGGEISELFLRGCGVPDAFILYARSLVGSPVEFYSSFISYSSKDGDFAERLHADLQAKGIRCWLDRKDILPGRKVYDQIDEAIRLHDKLLLVLSAHSIESPWVKTEIRKARQREREQSRQLLFPVRLASMEAIKQWQCFDHDAGEDLAVEVREYHIPDFSTWGSDPQRYNVALERVLAGLRSARPTKTPSGLNTL